MAKMGIVYGVGINDLRTTRGNPFYERWKAILQRCYGNRFVEYEGCKIAEEWLRFSVFKSWMEQQPWYGNEIDKDILCRDRKIYQPETSVFVPHWVNSSMIRLDERKGQLMTGVTYDHRIKKTPFYARIKDGTNENISLGYYSSELAAHQAWKAARVAALLRNAERYEKTPSFDVRVLDAIHAEALRLVS